MAEEDNPVQDGACLVVVALNGKDDRPDPSTLRAFLMTSAQGVSYNAGMWRECKAPKRGQITLILLDRPFVVDNRCGLSFP